jgi:hypothetical protein
MLRVSLNLDDCCENTAGRIEEIEIGIDLSLSKLRAALLAEVIVIFARIRLFSEIDDPIALFTSRWLELRGVRQLFEIVVVRAEIHIDLRIEARPALLAGLPIALVPLGIMKSAEGETAVIHKAAHPLVRKRNMLVRIIADPPVAAFGFSELSVFSADSAAKFLVAIGRNMIHTSLLPSIGLSMP